MNPINDLTKDLLVEGQVAVELKAVAEIMDVHEAQVLTHLEWADLQVGLLLNFSVEVLKDGIRRLVRGLPE
jgi:GxxExxY protein